MGEGWEEARKGEAEEGEWRVSVTKCIVKKA